MLRIFTNEKINKHANDYFLMLFNVMDENIGNSGYGPAFMAIFPEHLVTAELRKCKKVYNEIYSWITDEFLHGDFRPIHEHVLYRLLEMQSGLEDDNDYFYDGKKEKEELEKLRKTLSEEEKEYLDNVDKAQFFLDYLFEDNDFLYYEDFYNSFGTEIFNRMGYDRRLVELLPKDKRDELKPKLKEVYSKKE